MRNAQYGYGTAMLLLSVPFSARLSCALFPVTYSNSRSEEKTGVLVCARAVLRPG